MKTKSALLCAGAAVAAFTAARAATRGNPAKWIAGKVVVITGGSRGLGLALAEEFGRYGARLVLAARDSSELEKAKRRLVACRIAPEEVLTVACDLIHADEAERLIREASRHFGRVDVLVNSAGVIHVGPVEQQSLEMFQEAMNSNFFSMLYTTHAVLPQMLERRSGRIANICSIGGKIPVPHLAPYVASKFAAVGFSETLHAELRPKGIRVTTVNPGLMRTGSYPNAIVVGRKNEEYRWFRIAASVPAIAHSARYAARKIFRAVCLERTEVEIGLEAWLAARVHGVAPGLVQSLGGLAESIILPAPGGDTVPVKGTDLISFPTSLWKRWSDVLTRRFNQPPA
ncbi:MAG TPA: SDR family oxidoreductase [Bryobacteraceae bacterium]|jgi:short-subunit dehydrogenase